MTRFPIFTEIVWIQAEAKAARSFDDARDIDDIG